MYKLYRNNGKAIDTSAGDRQFVIAGARNTTKRHIHNLQIKVILKHLSQIYIAFVEEITDVGKLQADQR